MGKSYLIWEINMVNNYLFPILMVSYLPMIVDHISYLVGGIPTPLKNDGLRQWGWDEIAYMKWKIIQPCSSHHQPV